MRFSEERPFFLNALFFVFSIASLFIVPYFSIIPCSSALIPLCFNVFEFNFISTRPVISSPLKNVGNLSEWSFLSINLWRCLPCTSSKIMLQSGFLKRFTNYKLLLLCLL